MINIVSHPYATLMVLSAAARSTTVLLGLKLHQTCIRRT